MHKESNELCHQCKRPLMKVPMFTGKKETFTLECHNFDCSQGPNGLMTVREIDGTGNVISHTKIENVNELVHFKAGNPSCGESNVGEVAAAFIAAANSLYNTIYTDFKNTSTASEQGYDCIISTKAGDSLKLQITRPLPKKVYQEQASQGERLLKNTPKELAGWIREAVLKKSTRASPEIALVIDGIDMPAIGFIADTIAKLKYEEELSSQRWHSIWIIGHFGLRHLAGNPIPIYTAK